LKEIEHKVPEITSTSVDKIVFIIVDNEDVSRYSKMDRNQIDIPIDVLERALVILKALGHTKIKLMSYYCLSEKGFLLAAEDGSCGIKIPD
jgi:hypothetical protein